MAPGQGLVGMVDGSIPSRWTGILFRREVKDGIGIVDVEAGPFADAAYVFHAAARYPFVVIPGIAAALVVHPHTVIGAVEPLDGAWPVWWERMVSAVTEDQHVSQCARDKIRSVIYPSFPRIAAYQVLRALGEGDPVIAGQAAAGLRQCGHVPCAYILGFVVWMYKYVSVVRRILSLVSQHRKNATRQRIRELQVRFGHHVKFIRQLESVKGAPSD